MKNCIGYIRVSGINQIDGDGIKRQKENIKSFCEANRYNLNGFIEDLGVSGTALHRDGLSDIFSNDYETIIIEKLDRLSRDLIVGETIIQKMKENNLKLISVKEGSNFDDNPSRVMIRQIIQSINQFDKSNIVERLKIARERIRCEKGKCEGRKSITETNPDIVNLIKSFRRKRPGLKPMSFSKIAEKLNDLGHETISGVSWKGSNVQRVFKSY